MSSSDLVNSGKIEYGEDDDLLAKSLLEEVLNPKYQCDPIGNNTGDNVSRQAGPLKLWRVLTDREDDRITSSVPVQSPREVTASTPSWLLSMCAGIESGRLVLPGVSSSDQSNEHGLIEVKVDDDIAASTAAWLQSMLAQING